MTEKARLLRKRRKGNKEKSSSEDEKSNGSNSGSGGSGTDGSGSGTGSSGMFDVDSLFEESVEDPERRMICHVDMVRFVFSLFVSDSVSDLASRLGLFLCVSSHQKQA